MKKKAIAYQMKITLARVKPSIWRTVIVSPLTTLGELHLIIQAVMPWENYHLHEFAIGKKKYGDPETDDFGSKTRDEFEIDLKSLYLQKKRKFTYLYDFGDSWQHNIEIEKILQLDEKPELPICIAGERACPPEDSGGPWGFSDKRKVLSAPPEDQDEEIRNWMGDFDPTTFSLESANERLHRTFTEDTVDAEGELIEMFQAGCCWCLNDVQEDQEVFSQGIKLRPDFDREAFDGKVVPMNFLGREEPFLCFIPKKDSPAAKAGSEALFQLCSQKCVQDFRLALKNDMESLNRADPGTTLGT